MSPSGTEGPILLLRPQEGDRDSESALPKVTQLIYDGTLIQSHIRLHSPDSSPSGGFVIFSPLLDPKATLLHPDCTHTPGELSKCRFPHGQSQWCLRFCTLTQSPGWTDAAGLRILHGGARLYMSEVTANFPLKGTISTDILTGGEGPGAPIQQGRGRDQGELETTLPWVVPSRNLIPMLPDSPNF